MSNYINYEVGKSKPQRIITLGGIWNDGNERGIIAEIKETNGSLHVKIKYTGTRLRTYIIGNYSKTDKLPLSEIYND